jgi:hypothetical protein
MMEPSDGTRAKFCCECDSSRTATDKENVPQWGGHEVANERSQPRQWLRVAENNRRIKAMNEGAASMPKECGKNQQDGKQAQRGEYSNGCTIIHLIRIVERLSLSNNPNGVGAIRFFYRSFTGYIANSRMLTPPADSASVAAMDRTNSQSIRAMAASVGLWPVASLICVKGKVPPATV